MADSSVVVRETLTIKGKDGLHARPASAIVKVAKEFKADLQIGKDDQFVSGKSIMGIMMLAASEGSEIVVEARGEDAAALVAALRALVDREFRDPS